VKERLAKILLTKLTKEEVHILATAYDDGTLDCVMREIIIPHDVVQYPDQYPRTNDV
jgi:hypothetical protein